MKQVYFKRPLICLLTALLLVASLSSCAGEELYQATLDDLTYTLHGTSDRVEQITVTRNGRRIGAYQKRGMRADEAGENYGFRLTDLNFDRKPDMQLLIAREEGGEIYATYLWDEESGKHVYNAKLSGLHDMGMIASLGVLTAHELTVTIDPATDDTPEFEIRKEAFVIYRWQGDDLIPVHRKELTYYEESDIYCYLIEERREDGEWETIRESWITDDRFAPEKCPLDATGFEGYVSN